MPRNYTTRHALSLAEPDDLVVICADEITTIWKEVISYKPSKMPVDSGGAEALAELRAHVSEQLDTLG